IRKQFARMKLSLEVNWNTLEHEEQMCVPMDASSKAKWQRGSWLRNKLLGQCTSVDTQLDCVNTTGFLAEKQAPRTLVSTHS
ncbi:hypothetical protein Taro_036018, partial [Colocasia esculenta]|nr:hypothetical protein [Colocasia esculenta]